MWTPSFTAGRRIPTLATAIMVALLALGLLAGPAPVAPAAPPAGPPSQPVVPVQFERNMGQVDPAVQYLARVPGGTLYFGAAGLTLVPTRGADAAPAASVRAVQLQFAGGNPAPAIQPGRLLPTKVNYLIGQDRSRWHTGVPTYESITYGTLYPSIDLVYAGSGGTLKGTYLLAAHTDPAQIRWQYGIPSAESRGPQGGTEAAGVRLSVDAQGNLQIAVAADARGTRYSVLLTERAPTAWQTIDGRRVAVAARYVVDGPVAGFALGAYDPTRPLTIDPDLTFSTYLGGTDQDEGTAVAMDSGGNLYLAGYTASADFPVLNGYQGVRQGGSDAFLSKFDSAGQLVYSTYLGGSGNEQAFGVAVDASGAIYLSGFTGSPNFPLQNAYQSTFVNGSVPFLTRLTPDGAGLTYSTYYGVSISTANVVVAVDGAQQAYIAGWTNSNTLPMRNAFQATYATHNDAFVARFNTAGSGDSSLIYASYLGGSGEERVGSTGYGLGDWGHGVGTDGAGNLYVTGQTSSTDFPTHNAYQGTLAGQGDVFLARINTNLAGSASLTYSTYLGSPTLDAGKAVAVDATGNAYVTGEASSESFPTRNAYAACTNGPFVAKLNPAASGDASLIYSTCLGSGGTGRASDIRIDAAGNAYIVGTTNSNSFPLVNPIQPTLTGAHDVFVLKLAPAGNAVLFSTYHGGSGEDEGIGIAVDAEGHIGVAGSTASTNFPVHNAYQSTCRSCPLPGDAFLSRIDTSSPPPTATATPPPPPATATPRTPSPTPTLAAGNHPPVLVVPLNFPYRVGVEVGNYLALRFDASDPDAGDVVTLSASAVPAGANFPVPAPGNPIFSTFTWHPTASDIGTYYMIVTATDNHGAQTSATIQIDVVAGCVPYFADVFTSHYFYTPVQYLFCHLVVSGYIESDRTFTYRPFNNTTRGQFAKMIALAYQLPAYNPPTPDFSDVPPANPFYSYVESAYHAGIISGYADGTFRPFASITRGQLSKLIVGAAGWAIDTTGGPHFTDVPTANPFYAVIETAYNHGVISGYNCGGTGEPCDPQNHAYFRTYNSATRGQIAKILWQALGSPPPWP